MEKIILLVVDMQKALVEAHPYQEREMIERVKGLIACCREKEIEVVYVRHDDGEGSELTRGMDGWQIDHQIAPLESEIIFDKKYNSAFVKTGLKDYLNQKEVKTIILVGMQTEYCIDATCKSAFEHGYKVIIPENTNTTFDNEYLTGEKLFEFYNYKIWNHRFTEVKSMEEVEALLKLNVQND